MGSGKGQDDNHDDNNMPGLVLGLGYGDKPTVMSDHRHQEDRILKKKLSLKFDNVFPSLALGLVSDDQIYPSVGYTCKIEVDRQHHMCPLPASSASAATSFSNSSSIKRDRDKVDVEAEAEMADVDLEKLSSRVCDDHDRDQEDDQYDHDQASPRKKLRLTKEQSSVLEDSFKDHTTLNPKQKQELAKRLNLRPRQVEVWFQNRRARTKLKQTEMECELRKKCCEKLAEENKRLMKEIQVLKSMKSVAPVAPFYMHLQAAATLTMCPSCDHRRHAPSPITRPKPQLISNPFNHPSAAW